MVEPDLDLEQRLNSRKLPSHGCGRSSLSICELVAGLRFRSRFAVLSGSGTLAAKRGEFQACVQEVWLAFVSGAGTRFIDTWQAYTRLRLFVTAAYCPHPGTRVRFVMFIALLGSDLSRDSNQKASIRCHMLLNRPQSSFLACYLTPITFERRLIIPGMYFYDEAARRDSAFYGCISVHFLQSSLPG